MLLFDIGAILWGVGLVLLLRILFGAKERTLEAHAIKLIISAILQGVGGVLMFVSHYILSGNSSFITDFFN